jgi:hypothetical protein
VFEPVFVFVSVWAHRVVGYRASASDGLQNAPLREPKSRPRQPPAPHELELEHGLALEHEHEYRRYGVWAKQ